MNIRFLRTERARRYLYLAAWLWLPCAAFIGMVQEARILALLGSEGPGADPDHLITFAAIGLLALPAMALMIWANEPDPDPDPDPASADVALARKR